MSEGRPSSNLEASAAALEQLHLATGALVQAVPSLAREGWAPEPTSQSDVGTSQGSTSQTPSAPQVKVPRFSLETLQRLRPLGSLQSSGDLAAFYLPCQAAPCHWLSWREASKIRMQG